MDIKEAYTILGVSEQASINELEDRFFILIKREKTARETDSHDSNHHIDLDQLDEAYNLVRANILGDTTEESENSDRSLRGKIDNILYHYKFHIIGGIFLLLIVGSFLFTIVNQQIEKARLGEQVPPALTIVLLGEYQSEDLTPLQDHLASLFPEWERIKLDLLYTPKESRSQQDYGTVIKNQVTLTQANPDILIVDKHQYDQLVDLGSFLSLDQLSEDLAGKIDNEGLLYHQSEDDEEQHLYGINISTSEIFNNTDISGEKIITIIDGTNKPDNAFLFINRATESMN
ncbi:hypothetical protein GH741_14825 [Aquibacillus halophilus]|uniref:Uncharacterized protein n=1 Tax=Aquibacillus halophilus TaxID=930132 RepID=A0A6A8DEC3_9BACI|nr:hypothetical protein [Aquibacillus halophilus]MRH43914.1 hypothetical protein [Aquibacillus halophilus]